MNIVKGLLSAQTLKTAIQLTNLGQKRKIPWSNTSFWVTSLVFSRNGHDSWLHIRLIRLQLFSKMPIHCKLADGFVHQELGGQFGGKSLEVGFFSFKSAFFVQTHLVYLCSNQPLFCYLSSFSAYCWLRLCMIIALLTRHVLTEAVKDHLIATAIAALLIKRRKEQKCQQQKRAKREEIWKTCNSKFTTEISRPQNLTVVKLFCAIFIVHMRKNAHKMQV